MNDRLLLLMPSFMGYDKALKKALECIYEVDFVDNEIQWPFMNRYLRGNILRRGLGRVSRNFRKMYRNKAKKLYLDKMTSRIAMERDAYKVILCINGHFIPDSFWLDMKRNNPNAEFILYLWDDISNLYDIPNMSLFEKKYSFNIDDCREYGINYLPMFVQGNRRKHLNNNYDIAIVGTGHPDRIDFVKHFYERYKEQYKIFVYIYKKNGEEEGFIHNKPLTYEDYLDIISESRVLMDIPFDGQNGPTTRFFDALLTDTKVITVNSNIIKYPVYSNNILIISKSNPEIDSEFVYKEYETIGYKCLDAAEWLKKILGNQQRAWDNEKKVN